MELKMVKKLKGPSEDTSVPLGRRSSNLKRSDGGIIGWERRH